ncbi:hypothetical protein DFH08DRAFT_866945 [Mycena albidolilacea]|uniref:DUF6534 domain-containing protein n=1 Tax=Mycena albidolilacea TaxID=1033008 RepID=A0AAD7A1Z6_9AGAR|nr:hypothetical protein DFH08DRAFT_866945 [Mycena albidolilacea]
MVPALDINNLPPVSLSRTSLPMDCAVPSNLDASLGALQIGVFVSHVLFGVTTTQTYNYYNRFPDDSPKIKALVCTRRIESCLGRVMHITDHRWQVAFVWVCDAAHAICVGHTIYAYTITDYGHPERLARALPKSILVAAFLTGFIAALVQGFFTIRAYALSKRLFVSLIISAMVFVRLLGMSAISLMAVKMTFLAPFETQWGWLITLSWSISTITDLTITATLVVFLRDQRLRVHQRTTEVLDRLITWTIETALMTRLISIHSVFVTGP